jgi:AraC family transcriptional regulator of adaptative response/methylated-DNA-[protein]-cysteine methyltransferase
MYRALCQRDAAYEGVFVAAIRTTGIFCRPTCAARKPLRRNVEYYRSPQDALSAGYRPCKRCRPLEPGGAAPDWLQPLLDLVQRDSSRRWTDDDLRRLGVDPARARRWFRTHYGMTFHAYQRSRRMGVALERIRNGDELSRAAYDHGYESLSGFRDAFNRVFATTPGRSHRSEPIVVTRVLTPLGPMIAAAVDQGICLLEFADRKSLERELRQLSERFAGSIVPGDHDHLAVLENELERYFAGELREFAVPLVYAGTAFQTACWEWLRDIPYGTTRSYGDQARSLGKAGAQRAVGRANGENQLAIVIPCHRVIRGDGHLSGYGGGIWRKRRLLDHERRHLAEQEERGTGDE